MKKATLLLAAVLAIAVVLAGGKLLVSGDSFGLTNPAWDGISSVALDGRATPLDDFGRLRQAGPGDTLLIIGPSVDYTGAEAADVSYFMLNGGRAIVMDDYGTAGTLLEGLGSPIAIRPVPLCQDIDYYRSPALPLVGGVAYHPLTDGVGTLALNHPVPIRLSGDAVPLASTSSRAWLDADDNGSIDGDEAFGSYPVMGRSAYGKGELLVAGDADLLVNAMLRQGDNGVLLRNIMAGGTVYVDTGHGQPVPPLARLYYLVRSSVAVQLLCVLAIAALAGVYTFRGRARGRRTEEVRGRAEAARDRADVASDRAEARRSLIAAMKAAMPLSERDIKVLNKKL